MGRVVGTKLVKYRIVNEDLGVDELVDTIDDVVARTGIKHNTVRNYAYTQQQTRNGWKVSTIKVKMVTHRMREIPVLIAENGRVVFDYEEVERGCMRSQILN